MTAATGEGSAPEHDLSTRLVRWLRDREAAQATPARSWRGRRRARDAESVAPRGRIDLVCGGHDDVNRTDRAHDARPQVTTDPTTSTAAPNHDHLPRRGQGRTGNTSRADHDPSDHAPRGAGGDNSGDASPRDHDRNAQTSRDARGQGTDGRSGHRSRHAHGNPGAQERSNRPSRQAHGDHSHSHSTRTWRDQNGVRTDGGPAGIASTASAPTLAIRVPGCLSELPRHVAVELLAATGREGALVPSLGLRLADCPAADIVADRLADLVSLLPERLHLLSAAGADLTEAGASSRHHRAREAHTPVVDADHLPLHRRAMLGLGSTGRPPTSAVAPRSAGATPPHQRVSAEPRQGAPTESVQTASAEPHQAISTEPRRGVPTEPDQAASTESVQTASAESHQAVSAEPRQAGSAESAGTAAGADAPAHRATAPTARQGAPDPQTDHAAPDVNASEHARLVAAMTTLLAGAARPADPPGPGILLRAGRGERQTGCTACRICVSTCPEGALDLRFRDEVATLSLAPARCSGCGLCLDACPEDVLTLWRQARWSEQLQGEAAIPLATVHTSVCDRCGTRFAGRADDVCEVCAFRIDQPFGSHLPPAALEIMRRSAAQARQSSEAPPASAEPATGPADRP